MPAPYEGGCLCGAIRYRLKAEPLTFYVCHCTDCQKQTNTSFNLSMPVARESFERVRGEPGSYSVPLSGGRTWNGRYCTSCITRVWSEPPKFPQVINLRPGTLDDVAQVRPVGHIWTRSAQPWVTIPGDTLNYEGQPPDMTPMIRKFRERLRA
jgi:hypothetical protein